jgi:hypothetical protein
VTAATYGSATKSAVIVVDAKGRITSASEATISGGGGSGAETLITETVLAATTASVAFSSIAATYRDLRVVVRGRGDAAGVNNIDLRMQFNGDTAANYDWVATINNAASFFNSDSIAAIYGYLGQIAAATTTANVPGVSEARIYDYRATTFHKQYQAHCVTKRASTTGNLFNFHASGLWRSTAAITSVTVFPSSGNFIAGTVVSLYGIS